MEQERTSIENRTSNADIERPNRKKSQRSTPNA
jgi:hypothetical protein